MLRKFHLGQCILFYIILTAVKATKHRAMANYICVCEDGQQIVCLYDILKAWKWGRYQRVPRSEEKFFSKKMFEPSKKKSLFN